jgi:hypothetical protein
VRSGGEWGDLVAGGYLTQVVIAAERRPYDTSRHALALVPKAHDDAFPPDHAPGAGAFCVSVLHVLGLDRPRARGREHGTGSERGSGTAPWRCASSSARRPSRTSSSFSPGCTSGRTIPGDVVSGVLLGGATVVAVSSLRPHAFRILVAAERMPLAVLARRPTPTARRVRGRARSPFRTATVPRGSVPESLDAAI